MKFYVKDEDGTEYTAEEISEEEIVPEEHIEPHDEALSDDEISALKKLAEVADKLVALVADKVEDDDEDIDEEDNDEEEIKEVDEDEDEVVDTRKKSKDSKTSVGSLERKHLSRDSYDDLQENIADSWNKRFNGGNK